VADLRTCRECRETYARKRIDQNYCSSVCSRAADNRELKRARAVYRALYHWRNDRSAPKVALVRTCLRFICREVRDWIDQDRVEGRLPPPRPAEWVPRGHEKRKAVRAIATSNIEERERVQAL
jgi:hypothetical protein